MRISFRLAALAAGILVSTGIATQSFGQTTGTNVVVLDVGKVFKEHARFKQSMEMMKKDVEAFEAYVRRQRDQITAMAEGLKNYNPGSPEYKDIEAKAAKSTSDVQVEMGLKRREFMEREAKLYFNTYTEVTNVVQRFADDNGIALVLRYNSEDINPDDRNSVLQGVNNNIVFQRNRDITATIIDVINRRSPTPPPGPLTNRTGPQLPQRN